jgi:RimJ/RimL family protein N-acetyltransferase
VTIPNDLILEGDRVRLEPLAARHLPELAANDEAALWEFTYQPTPFDSEANATAWLSKATQPTVRAFAIVERASGQTIGSTRFHTIDEENRKLEIGWTFLRTSTWRTGINRECKLLLLRYAFEEWNAVRVQFKADERNLRSRDALAALGAVCEGTHRNFRIRHDGERRGVTFFSIIESEWPSVRDELQRSANRKPTSV